CRGVHGCHAVAWGRSASRVPALLLRGTNDRLDVSRELELGCQLRAHLASPARAAIRSGIRLVAGARRVGAAPRPGRLSSAGAPDYARELHRTVRPPKPRGVWPQPRWTPVRAAPARATRHSRRGP